MAHILSTVVAPVSLPPGVHVIDSSATVDHRLTTQPGARLQILNGVTLTLNGGFNADADWVFDCVGTGRVEFDRRKVCKGHPEWWGASVDDPTADNTAALNACIEQMPITCLQFGDYRVLDTVRAATSYRTITGTKKTWDTSGTSITIAHATKPAMYFGHDTQAVWDGRASDFSLRRSVTLGAGSVTLLVKNMVFCELRDINIMNAQRAVYLSGNIRVEMYTCYAQRTQVASGLANDFFNAFYLDGSGVGTQPMGGGNASTTFWECTGAVMNPELASVPSSAFQIDKAGADTWIIGGESSNCHYGVGIIGSQGHAKELSGDTDILVQGVKIDGYRNHGIVVDNIATTGVVRILDNYITPASGTPLIAVGVYNSVGSVLVRGNECQATGIRIDSSYGVKSIDNIITNAAKPIEIHASGICESRDRINNPTISASQAAVRLTGSTNRCTIAPLINGAANRFPAGVELATAAESLNEINMTGIHSGAIVGGKKIVANGAHISASGPFAGGNLATGIA